MAKVTTQAIKQILSKKDDPAFIYKLHMSQLKDTRKMFKGDAGMQTKLDEIEAKIKATYQASI